ncbi:MAG: hypothetical protein HOP19_19955, partial [Acidobacteria bacterium]|nr:hypothetical protein [Acidobacteriota bacterium]
MLNRSKQLCAGLLLLALSYATAEATLMKYLEIEDLARLSTEIIHGQVLATKTYWDDSHTRILTAVRVQVSECFKGKSARGATITLVQLGGTLDGRTMDYSGRPTFRVGEDMIVFTRPNQHNELLVVGLKQGKLAIHNNEAQRELGGVTFIDADMNVGNSANRAQARKTVQM